MANHTETNRLEWKCLLDDVVVMVVVLVLVLVMVVKVVLVMVMVVVVAVVVVMVVMVMRREPGASGPPAESLRPVC